MLVEPHRVAALFLVALVIIAVPGPSVLFVVGRGVSLGRRAALATVAGNETGLLVQVVAVAVGLGTIVERSIVVYQVVRLVGALYLVYLGIQAVRRRRDLGTAIAGGAPARSLRRVYLDGAVVGVSNPKSLLLFAAILPQFVDPALGHVRAQLFVLGLVCVGIALVCDSAWGLFAGTARVWLGRSRRRLEAIGGGAGLVMIGLGVRLALTGQKD